MSGKDKDEDKGISIKNRKASFEYSLMDHYTAGLQLKGTEIKSIRSGKAAINDAFCFFEKGELWVRGLHISEYEKASFSTHDPLRNRKLLLKKREIKKISNTINDGVTIVPLKLFISNKGWAKLEIAIAKGKKQFDKRETIKRRELERTMGRKMK